MTVLRKLEDAWFMPAPGSRLALLRILVGCFALYYVGNRYSMYLGIAGTDPQLYDPVGLARLFGDAPWPIVAFQGLLIATLATNVAFVLGCGHRVTGPLFATLLMATLCYRNSWSMIYHTDNLLVFHTVILGVSRSADVLSIDAAWRARRGLGSQAIADLNRASIPDPSRPNWRYGWPIRLICATTVAVYFLSGIAKVCGPLGWAWAGGSSMRDQIAVDGVRKELLGANASPMIGPLYDQVWLFTMLGVVTLILEIGAPLFLIHRTSSKVWAIACYGMHWGIYFLMAITFRYQLWGVAFASFFAIEHLAQRFGVLIPEASAQETTAEPKPVAVEPSISNTPSRSPSSIVGASRR